MKTFIKKLCFGDGKKPRKIWFGRAAGTIFEIDPAKKSQRILGLDEWEIARDFQRLAKAAGSFIDVGASDGYYCVLAQRFHPGMRIVGCDPASWEVGRAERHFELNFPAGVPSFSFVRRFVGRGTGEDFITLDAVAEGLPRPVFVKIDVDNYELDVLQSGPKLLAEADTLLLIETHSVELEKNCIGLLTERGFVCRVIKNAWWRLALPETRGGPTIQNRWLVAEKKKS